jgi:hypothetical protein
MSDLPFDWNNAALASGFCRRRIAICNLVREWT